MDLNGDNASPSGGIPPRVDSHRANHYLFHMIRCVNLLLTILLLGFAPGLPAAKLTTLMLLEHAEAGKAVQAKIDLKSGVVLSKDKDRPREKWVLRPGEAVAAATRPSDRAVSFFRIVNQEIKMLFVVKARYFQRHDGKWVPQFQLGEEPMIMRGPDGRWKPLNAVQDEPSLIVHSGAVLPNADGYAALLEFSFSTGPASIDAWQVQ